jgi:hypothetical protein
VERAITLIKKLLDLQNTQNKAGTEYPFIHFYPYPLTLALVLSQPPILSFLLLSSQCYSYFFIAFLFCCCYRSLFVVPSLTLLSIQRYSYLSRSQRRWFFDFHTVILTLLQLMSVSVLILAKLLIFFHNCSCQCRVPPVHSVAMKSYCVLIGPCTVWDPLDQSSL